MKALSMLCYIVLSGCAARGYRAINNKHGTRLASITLSALVFSPALAGLAEGVNARKRGEYETARSEYLKAAQDGDSNAQNNLARLFRPGLGGPVDMKQAGRLEVHAHEKGEAP